MAIGAQRVSDDLLLDTAGRLCADHVTPQLLAAAERGDFPAVAWAAIEAAALHRALVPEASGGFGVPVIDALAMLRVAGQHALPLPLAETMLAGMLLAGAGLEVPEGPLTLTTDAALTLRREGSGWQLTGRAAAVAWARDAAAIAVLAEHDGQMFVALLRNGSWQSTPGANVAREPRDTIGVNTSLPAAAVAPTDIGRLQVRAVGAAMRAIMIAGVLDAITGMTVQYAQDRVQFGRSIGKFQAIQHNLAILASQTAAAGAAADMAAEAVADGVRIPAIAAAKVRAGEAASIAAGLAHQIHGAIGFTYEHRLHFFTKRLWAWRDEYGGEAEWSLLLGRHMAAAGADRLWPEITAI
jgi:alkylation response protein AidB-like acyl-CoA dehydrogenase